MVGQVAEPDLHRAGAVDARGGCGRTIAPDVLRHRVLTTYEAEAEEVTSDEIVRRVLATVESP